MRIVTGRSFDVGDLLFDSDRWRSPAVESQTTDGASRIGKTKNLQVHNFLCVSTLEDRTDERIECKKELAEKAVGTGQGWLTELPTADLKELFALRTDAVAR